VASAKAFRREVIARCEAAGWRKREGTNHTILYPPDGSRPLVLSHGTGSTSGRAMDNIKQQLKRQGIEL
jgi:hypothetical protein